MRNHPATAPEIRLHNGHSVARPGTRWLQCARCSGKTFFAILKGAPGAWQTAGFVCSDPACGHIIELED